MGTFYSMNFPSPQIGYAIGSNGRIFKTENASVGIREIGTEIPSSYKLEQNYPNPFNPTTVIQFSIPTREFVHLRIYNIKGQQIDDLINSTLAPATYEIQFSGNHLSSGVYYYNLVTKDFTETKKMLLLK